MFFNLRSLLFFSTVLFFIGIFGIILNRRNVIIVLMSIELMLLSVNLNFIYFSIFLDDFVGQVFSLFVLTVAAAESAVGLAILVTFYKIRGNIKIESLGLIRGLQLF